MTRLFCVGLAMVAVLGLAAPNAWASVPDPDNSCWSWRDDITGTGHTVSLICPAGDAAWIYASVKDQFGQPMPGIVVTADFSSDCPICLCCPVSGITDVNGDASLRICGGIDASGDTTCCSVMTEVTCLGVTIHYCPICPPPGGVCSRTETRDWISPDLDGDCMVGGLDFSIFARDWLCGACRSDFDCSGGPVGGLDFAASAVHWLHNCDGCPYCP